MLEAFTPAHQPRVHDDIEVGAALLVVGFPLGFHDLLHHLPVVRQAVITASYGMRFQSKGYFLTDARTHRGTSGAAVLMRDTKPSATQALPWKLLGMHSSRMDIADRDRDHVQDEALGLNCAWYDADILRTLTEPRVSSS